MARVPYVEASDVPDEYEDLLESSLQEKPLHVYQSIGNNPEVLAGSGRSSGRCGPRAGSRTASASS